MAIVINSTTGEIDLDQTTPGTYVVTYTVQGVSSNQEVTVNAVDNAGFSYSSSSYAPTDADPTPSITGLTGGTFSAGSGLVFVDSGTNTGSSTGEIDLSASTVATHTITYNTSSSGSSVCPNTSTQTVEIALAGISNVYSMNFDSASSDYIDTNYILDVTSDFSVSTWIKIDGNSDHNILGTREQTTGASVSKGFTLSLNSSKQIYARIFTTTSSITQVNAGVIQVGQWFSVVATYVASTKTLKIYRNGIEMGSVTGTSAGVTSPDNLSIGRVGIGGVYGYFNGKIDEVAIWNTALTSTQVAEIYNATGTNLTKDLTTVSGSNLIYWNRMGD